MTLNIKHSGVWEEVDEVHIKENGSWERVHEVYVNKNGIWYPTLFTATANTFTTPGAGSVDVPNSAYRASVTIRGGDGGHGGYDGGMEGGEGGRGAELRAIIDVVPGQTLSFVIAERGENGRSGTAIGGGQGGTGYNDGGDGGGTGGRGWSGSGGGGGGSTSLSDNLGNVIMIAAGGGGGGGRGNRKHIRGWQYYGDNIYEHNKRLIEARVSLDWDDISGRTPLDYTDTLNTYDGGNGQNCTTADGGGGGGAGAGAGYLAQGGDYYGTYDSDGYGGNASQSYINNDYVRSDLKVDWKKDLSHPSYSDGSITFTWLPDKL